MAERNHDPTYYKAESKLSQPARARNDHSRLGAIVQISVGIACLGLGIYHVYQLKLWALPDFIFSLLFLLRGLMRIKAGSR